MNSVDTAIVTRNKVYRFDRVDVSPYSLPLDKIIGPFSIVLGDGSLRLCSKDNEIFLLNFDENEVKTLDISGNYGIVNIHNNYWLWKVSKQKNKIKLMLKEPSGITWRGEYKRYKRNTTI